LHLSTPIVNNCKIYESNDDDVREVCDYSECNSSTGIDSTSEEIDMQSDGDDEIEITREGELHPAEDNLMNWSLESPFIDELKSPTFLG
ncbi:19569_t:CDS:2, partial [Entrophospora sp. SA101]